MCKKLFSLIAASIIGSSAANAAFVTVGSASENRITTDTRWTRDNVYILSRVIFVTNGAVLTIEPGTIVRGVQAGVTGFNGIPAEPGTLVIARGSKIVANGTVDDPIIFTSIDDPNVPGGAATIPSTWRNPLGAVQTIKGTTRHGALQSNDYTGGGLSGDNVFSKFQRWGGVILCGRGYVAQNTPRAVVGDANSDEIPDSFTLKDPNDASLSTKGQNQGTGADYVEGLSTENGSTVLNSSLAIYGGTNDADNSGVMRFCSLRYGGYIVQAGSSGNEINGLTLCACGEGTRIEFIEVFCNLDDGFEWFGGKHDTRFLFSIANADDSFDGDEGYRGTNQFWTAYQGTVNGVRRGYTFRSPASNTIGQERQGSDYSYDMLMEWDGGEPNNNDVLPLTRFNVFNATFISGETNKRGVHARLETQLGFYNSVIENPTFAFRIDDTTVGGIYGTTLTMNNVHGFRAASTISKFLSTPGVGVTENGVGFVSEPSSQIAVSPTGTGLPINERLYAKEGAEMRLRATADARNQPGAAITPPAGDIFVPVKHAGSMKDNHMLAGWSVLSKIGALPSGNTPRVDITMGINGSDNPTVTFSGQNGVDYVIERSSDQKTWIPIGVVAGTGAAVTTADATTTLGSSPLFYRAYAL
ncbi:MAG: hypothetical protein JNJ83_21390 [Verrucomicrobiaceae bacterium]|nr:hypothetical protein [Verrucomicrobiaceae bacterium]